MSNERWNEWYYKNHEENKAKKAVQMKKWRAENKEKSRHQSRQKVVRMRDAIHEMYGHVCALCGYENKQALTLDHIAGNGNVEREELGAYGVYRRAIEKKRQDEYRILCMNCQFIERQRLKSEWQQQHSPYCMDDQLRSTP
jgi:hypothetical protein